MKNVFYVYFYFIFFALRRVGCILAYLFPISKNECKDMSFIIDNNSNYFKKPSGTSNNKYYIRLKKLCRTC